MKMKIGKEEYTKEEIEIVFVVEHTRFSVNWDERIQENVINNTTHLSMYADVESATKQMEHMMRFQASELSELDEYFGVRDYAYSEFECDASNEQVRQLKSALHKHHLIGHGDEPDIIKLWREHQDGGGYREAKVSFKELCEALKQIDCTNYADKVTEKAKENVLRLLDTDWTVNHNNKGEWYKMYESDDHPSYYNNEKSRMNAVRSLTMHNYDWQDRISEIKHYRWEESDEGKAEIQAENERHQEMMTFMGESGLHSYSIDSEGTYTMWR